MSSAQVPVRARSLPWWLLGVVGVVLVVVGAWLLGEPFRSLSVLVGLVAASFVITGVGELLAARSLRLPWWSYLAGLLWLGAGVLAAAWPHLTILGLAVLCGVSLIVGGLMKVAAGFIARGWDRITEFGNGLSSVIVGLLALSWPAVTVLVIAVLVGLRAVLAGLRLLILAFSVGTGRELRRPVGPRWLRAGIAVVGVVLALAGLALSVAIHRAGPAAPGPFYTAPSPLPADPAGTIIREQVVPGAVADATTYRVLYLSTGYDGKPAAVSGLIIVPTGPAPAGGRDVLAYTHGTVGVASNCAPSLLTDRSKLPLLSEGGALFVHAGYVIAASDYQGLGTKGPHPYLIGDSEAKNELDIVRAAHNLTAAHASTTFAIWGHSQGGQSALFTAQLAAGYAPDLHLVGVAAGGPVPDLPDLFQVNIKTTVGKILISMALQSWSRVYHDADLDQIVTPAARPLVAKIARNCLYNQNQSLASVPASLALNLTFISTPLWTVEPWKTIITVNTPGQTPITVPVLIVQGTADTIVDPAATQKLVIRMCGNGATVDQLLLPGVDHLATGHTAAPDVAAWIADRFAGRPAVSTCAK